MIKVSATPTASGWTCAVDVTDKGSSTQHTVQVRKSDLERWGRGGTVEDLVRRSFEFLLQREPKESIMKTFELAVIPRYFPEYDQAIRQ